MQLREQSRVQKLIYENGTNPPPAGLLRFLGAALRSSPSNVVEWVPMEGALPMATSGQEIRYAGPDETLRHLAEPDFDPARVVYLPEALKEKGFSTTPGQAQIHSATYAPERIDLEVEADGPAVVVIAQSYYPNWRARIDDQGVELWRANYAFQAVAVPPGRHHLTLKYQDRRLRVGGLISLGTLLGCVAALIRWRAITPSNSLEA